MRALNLIAGILLAVIGVLFVLALLTLVSTLTRKFRCGGLV